MSHTPDKTRLWAKIALDPHQTPPKAILSALLDHGRTRRGHDHLWRAYKAASDPAIIDLLAQALIACSPSGPLPSGPAIPAWLNRQAGKARKLPRFLRPDPLPPVHTRGGSRLDPKAMLGLIKLLERRSGPQYTADTRSALALFRRADIEALGADIAQRHNDKASNAASDAWGVEQQALTTSEAFIVAWGFVPGQRGSHRALYNLAYRTSLARHGSFEAWSLLHGLPGFIDALPSGPELLRNLGVDIKAAIKQGRLTRGYGLELRQSLRGDLCEKGHTQNTYEETRCKVSLRRVDPIVPGQLLKCPLTAEITHIVPATISRFDGLKIKKNLKWQQGRLNTHHSEFQKWLRDHGEGVAWSLNGFQDALGNAWMRLSMGGLLFRTRGGPVFAVDPDGRTANVNGEGVHPGQGELIRRVLFETLSSAERGAWSARFEAWAPLWPAPPTPVSYTLEAPQTSDRLAELRALVYDTPSESQWGRIARRLEDWPIGQDLNEAVEYVAHRARGWPLWCMFLASWIDGRGPFEPGEDPRLRVCNHWVWAGESPERLAALSGKPNLSNIRKLTLSPASSRLRSLPETHLAPFEDEDLWPNVTHVHIDPSFKMRGPHRLARFAGSTTMQGLNWLGLERLGGTAMIRALEENGAFDGLKHLMLDALDDDTFEAVLGVETLGELDTLTLHISGQHQSHLLAVCPWIGSVKEIRLGRMWQDAHITLTRIDGLPEALKRALEARPADGSLPPEPF